MGSDRDDRWVAPRPRPNSLKAGLPPYGKKVFLVRRALDLPVGLIGIVPEQEEYERLRVTKFSNSAGYCIVIMRNMPHCIPCGALSLG